MTRAPSPADRRPAVRAVAWALAAFASMLVGVGVAWAATGGLDRSRPPAPPAAAPAPTTTTTSRPNPTPTTSTTPSTSTIPTTSTIPSTSTTVPASTAPPAAPDPAVAATLRAGDRGPAVARLQERLGELHLWVPAVDGVYGDVTAQAVMAFQKHAGLARDGIAGPATRAALDTARPVTAREAGDHVEIDLDRQLLIVVRDGTTVAFTTTTGAPGWRTPPGRFRVDRQIDGMRHAPLGDLWRPKYFNAGIAMHGSPSIPGHPASHGCARLHDDAIDAIWENGLAPLGTPVWVY